MEKTIIIASLVLVSCQEESRIIVSQHKDQLTFHVEPDHGVCVSSFSVMENNRVLWRINSQDTCAREFRYCDIPTGFVQEGGCQALIKGKSYSAVSVGGGIEPETQFVFRAAE